MSQIEELIEKLCSNGVEWKTLGEVCEMHGRIGWQGLTKKDYRATGKYLLVTGTDFLSSNKINYNTCVYVDEDRYTQDKYIQLKENDLLITKDGTIGKLAIVQDLPMPATLNGGVFVIRDKTKTLDHRFLMYIMASSHFKNQIEKKHTNGTIKHLTQNLLVSYAIPVPPLEIQTRIVEILDNFTNLTTNLTAELTLRRKQFEYYREKLLSLDGVEWKTLGDVCVNFDSKRKPITSSNRVSGDIPYYGASGIVDYVDGYIFDGDYLLISEDGANLLSRNTPIAFSISGKTWVNNHAHILYFENQFNRKFVEYYINNIDLTPYISDGAQPKLNQANLNRITIPYPSDSIQQSIVSILDKFSSLIENIETELSLRQKQYEYYREQLLNF